MNNDDLEGRIFLSLFLETHDVGSRMCLATWTRVQVGCGIKF